MAGAGVGGGGVSVAGGGTGVSEGGGVTCKQQRLPGDDHRAGGEPVPGHQLAEAHAVIAGDPGERLAAADGVIVLAVAGGSEALDGRQRAGRGAGGEIPGVDHQLLTDLQGRIELQAVVRQDLLHAGVVRFGDLDQRVVRLHLMHHPAVGVGGADADHAHRRGGRVALGIAAGDEELLPDLQLIGPRDVVPGLQVGDGDPVGNGDRPQRLPGFDLVVDTPLGVGLGDLDRDDDARDAGHAAGNGVAAAGDGGVLAAGFIRGIGRLQDVVGAPIVRLGDARPDVAVRRVDGGDHVRGVGPGKHDLIDAEGLTHGEVLGSPNLRPAAVTGCLDAAAHIPDVRGHVVGSHDLRRPLGDGVDDRVFDQRRQPVGNAQRVHGDDQVVGGHLTGAGRSRVQGGAGG